MTTTVVLSDCRSWEYMKRSIESASMWLHKITTTTVVVIDAEDTDVVVLCAHVAHKIEGVLGFKRKKSVLDCKKLCTADMASIIVPLHIHTGADAVSGFYGCGEKSCFWICCWEHWGTWFVEIGWIISSCDKIGLWKHGAFHCQIHISWSKLPDFIQSTSFKMESIEIQVNTKAATRQGLSWTPYPESKLSSVHTTELRQTRCTTFANWKWMVSWKWNM